MIRDPRLDTGAALKLEEENKCEGRINSRKILDFFDLSAAGTKARAVGFAVGFMVHAPPSAYKSGYLSRSPAGGMLQLGKGAEHDQPMTRFETRLSQSATLSYWLLRKYPAAARSVVHKTVPAAE